MATLLQERFAEAALACGERLMRYERLSPSVAGYAMMRACGAALLGVDEREVRVEGLDGAFETGRKSPFLATDEAGWSLGRATGPHRPGAVVRASAGGREVAFSTLEVRVAGTALVRADAVTARGVTREQRLGYILEDLAEGGHPQVLGLEGEDRWLSTGSAVVEALEAGVGADELRARCLEAWLAPLMPEGAAVARGAVDSSEGDRRMAGELAAASIEASAPAVEAVAADGTAVGLPLDGATARALAQALRLAASCPRATAEHFSFEGCAMTGQWLDHLGLPEPQEQERPKGGRRRRRRRPRWLPYYHEEEMNDPLEDPETREETLREILSAPRREPEPLVVRDDVWL